MSYKVIKAEFEDAELLTQLGSKYFKQTFEHDNTEEQMNDYLDSAFQKQIQEQELSDPTFFTYFLYKMKDENPNEKEEAIGFFQLRNDKTTVYDFIQDEEAIELKRIYIDQQCIGNGLGRLLMDQCLAIVQSLGKQTVWLGVYEHNHIAQKFYRKYGFYVVGDHIFKVGDKEDRDLIMIKKMDA
ncbi:unnamed protein product [Cunninghamella blakesleeana]